MKEIERRTDTYPNLRYLAIALWTYSITNRFTKWITVGWGLRSIRLEYKNTTPFFFNSRKENNIRGYFHAINAFRQSLPTVVWKAKMNWILMTLILWDYSVLMIVLLGKCVLFFLGMDGENLSQPLRIRIMIKTSPREIPPQM